jgi:2-methylisocitrate lyase-like PEP mutase family enzyme
VGDFLGAAASGPARLRALLAEPGPLVLPGCYDALSARLAEQAGFDAVYMTGFGAAASLLGRPDVGLLTASEMVEQAGRIVSATTCPVVGDADTGYGNALNAIRAVQQFERAGVAGVHIEDQVFPKRCGHLEDKQVVPAPEFLAKLDAVLAARRDPDFVVIARTDARGPLGLDAAIERGHAALGAGADALFVEAAQTVEEVERIAAEFRGSHLLYNWVDGGKSPALSLAELDALGFAMVIMPVTALFAATRAVQAAFASLRAEGTPRAGDTAGAFDEFVDLIGVAEIRRLEDRFS